MANSIKEAARAQELEPSLGELIHHEVRVAIEMAVHEELCAALGTTPYERSHVRRGYRNGTKTRTLTDRARGSCPRGDPRCLPSHRICHQCRGRPCCLRDLRAYLGQALSGRRSKPTRGWRRTPHLLHLSKSAVENAQNHQHD